MESAVETVAKTGLKEAFVALRQRSQRLRSEPVRERARRLRQLEEWLLKNRTDLERAVYQDLHKPAMEVVTSEFFPVLAEIRHALANLDRWTAPVKVDAPLTFLGTRSEIRREPRGACLIIAPWNYPFMLCIGPLVSALAAGNTVMLKPSETTPHTSALVKKLADEVFDKDLVYVAEGDASVATELLSFPFDHIFFTGSPAVGKIVMRAASEHLASVTLELGGKSPAVVDRTAHLPDAAKRIAFSKFLNNGQTCIAPDYVLVENSVKDKFIELLMKEVDGLFGAGSRVSEASADYARIVNTRHYQRLNALVQDAIAKGAQPVMTGNFSEANRFIPPTILTGVTKDMLVMVEEIFGPILPVLGFEDKSEVIPIVHSMPRPLSLYLFSNDKSYRQSILAEIPTGGVCINDCLLQFVHPNVPFGGVNHSGIGKAHGHAGFLAFTNEKPVIRQKRGYSTAHLFYPPYTSFKRKILDVVLRWLG